MPTGDDIDFDKLRAGDPEEWEQVSALVDSRLKRKRLARGLETDKLEDIRQDALLSLFRNRSHLVVAWGWASFLSLVDTVITNKLRDWHRRRRDERERLVDLDRPSKANDPDLEDSDIFRDIPDGSPQTAEIAGARLKLELLPEIMNELPGKCPEVLWGMVRVEAGEISKAQLMQELGIPSQAAYDTRLSRCWKELMKHPKLRAVTGSKD